LTLAANIALRFAGAKGEIAKWQSWTPQNLVSVFKPTKATETWRCETRIAARLTLRRKSSVFKGAYRGDKAG